MINNNDFCDNLIKPQMPKNKYLEMKDLVEKIVYWTIYSPASLAIGLLMWSNAAHADPFSIGATILGALGFGGSVAFAGFVGVVAIGAAIYASVSFLGYLGMKMPDLSNQESATKQAEGVQIQRRGSVEQIPVVYGYRRIAGVITFATTGGEKNKYLWVCYTMCEGPVEGLVKVYIDDWDLDTDNPGAAAGNTVPAYLNANVSEDKTANKPVNITWGKYKNRARLFFSKGEYYTSPSSITVNNYVLGAGGVFEGVPTGDNGYKEQMVHNGLCTIWARYEWNPGEDNPFTGSIPLLHIELLGRKVTPLYTQSNIASTNNLYDTKVTSTESGSYGTNERYSTNPVEILLDYLRNPRYGKGLNNTDIDWNTWYKAAAKCNQMVPSSITGQTHRILQLNAVVQTDATIMNNVKTMLQNFRAYMPYHQGKYKLRIEDAGNETDILSGVATIKRTFATLKSSQRRGISPPIDNIIGDVSYTGIDRSSKYNQVVVQYVEPEEKFTNQSVTYPPTLENGTNPDGSSYFGQTYYYLQDGSRDYRYEITLPGVINRDQALDMAQLIFNKSRFQETCTLTVTSEAMNLELGDNIYISSTVLDFIDPVDATNTIPWRIVSFTLQENHNIQLQCVRNPDTIYPYSRKGEKDIVLPIYVPKGAERQLALNVELFPRGIVPPTKASLPAGTSISNALINTTPSNVAASNNSVSTATTSTALSDVVNITGVRTVYVAGQAYLVLIWRQPNVAMFRSLLISATAIVGAGTASPALNFEYIGSPREGDIVEYQIGPVAPGPNSTYSIVSRIKYSTLQQSTATSSFNASVDATVGTTPATTTTTTTPTTTPPSTTTTTTPTTTPVYTAPTTTAPAPAVRDNYCLTILGDVTAANYAADPRVITWTLTLNATNSDVIGFNYYIKPTVETYWRTFQGRNSGGVAFNSSLPTVETTTLTNVGRATAFDLIIRVAYKDGSESTKQQRLSFNITSPFGVYPYNFFYGINTTAILENTSAYTPTLTPPGFVGTAADIRMGVVSTQYKLTNGILINLNPPAIADRSYWYGQTIRYRPFTPGSNPAFTSILDKTVTPIVDGTIPVIISPIVYDQKYEIVITPYVNVSGTKRDADYSWYGVGYVNNSTTSIIFPPDGNWNFNFNWQNVLTSSALQTINTAFAPPVMADATVQLSQFDTYNVNGNYTSDSVDNGSSFVLQAYHKLGYSGVGITNYKGVRIYRRSVTLTAPSETTGTYAAYWGWGRWEYIDTILTTATLRGPVVASEFNAYYQVAGGSGSSNLLAYGYQGAYTGTLTNNNKKQIQPANLGNQQFLIVVQYTDNSFSTKGLLVNVARSKASTPNPYNQLKPNLPQVVSLTSYNSYTAGYLRNLSEARSVIANTGIGLDTGKPFAGSGTEASITKFVTYPTTDSTVGGAITPAIQ